MAILTACLAAALALIHFFIGRLSGFVSLPRNVWLSGAGGIAVSYVFLHILPDLAAHQQRLGEEIGAGSAFAEKLVFLCALAGLAAFYGLEHFARVSRVSARAGQSEKAVGDRLFWIHLGSFSFYNLIIGYLLVHREDDGIASLLLYFFAMATHFVASDVALRQDHDIRYDRIGRWIMSGAVIAGWALASVTRLPDLAVGLMFAFLAGGIVMNVLKEELPEDRKSRFLPFIAGVVGYALILAFI